MSGCCPSENTSCDTSRKIDWILWGSVALTLPFYLYHDLFLDGFHEGFIFLYSHKIAELLDKMWLGIGIGIVFIAILDMLPQAVVLKFLASEKGAKGLWRATLSGVFFDLCSHGILLVGMKLYKQGARLGQVMAFLIASPWNSISLTVILGSLIGWGWTVLFLILSMAMAFVTGYVFDVLVHRGVLPENPNTPKKVKDISLRAAFRENAVEKDFSFSGVLAMLWGGFLQSRMILKWLFFGVVIAGLIQVFIDGQVMRDYFGPSLMGLGMTLIFATLFEVCSEGSVPIAHDLFARAGAPGNAFTFLMAGVSTDYTEMFSLRETTGSWKIALFLPLLTLPQILLLAYFMNFYG